MHDRGAVRREIAGIEPIDDEERVQQADALRWIDSGAPLYRTARPATPPKHLVAYSVLVDPDCHSVLLVDHRLARRWLPAGGHVEPGEAPAVTASRELREELGISTDILPSIGPRPLFVTVTRTANETPGHTDVSLWYVFHASEDRTLTPDPGEFVSVKWWPLTEVGSGTDARCAPELSRFAAKLAPYLG